MSSDSEIVSFYQSVQLIAYADYAATALVGYDYILTVPAEARLVWRRKWTGLTVLFMMNRYTLVAYVIYAVAPFTNKVCRDTSGLIDIVIDTLPSILAFAISILRVFALSGRNTSLTALMSVLCVVPECIYAYLDSQERPSYSADPIGGSFCNYSASLSDSIILRLQIVAGILAVGANALVLLVTWYKTFRNTREAAQLGMRAGLSDTLLRDGSLFFLTVLGLDVIQIFYNSLPTLQSISLLTVMLDVSYVLPPILLSHFFINLREVAEPSTSDDSAMRHFSRFSAPGFRVPTITVDRVVGNLGEPLELRDDLDDDDLAERHIEDQPADVEELGLDVVEVSLSGEERDNGPVVEASCSYAPSV